MGRFGERFAKLRREQTGLSLREFCANSGLDAGNISRLERGRMAVPASREILERYASALGLEENTDEWVEFFDLAAAERGVIPAELLADDEVAAKLPMLFRTLRGDPVTEEQLQSVIDMIKRA